MAKRTPQIDSAILRTLHRASNEPSTAVESLKAVEHSKQDNIEYWRPVGIPLILSIIASCLVLAPLVALTIFVWLAVALGGNASFGYGPSKPNTEHPSRNTVLVIGTPVFTILVTSGTAAATWKLSRKLLYFNKKTWTTDYKQLNSNY